MSKTFEQRIAYLEKSDLQLFHGFGTLSDAAKAISKSSFHLIFSRTKHKCLCFFILPGY